MTGYYRLGEFDRAVWTALGLARIFDWKPSNSRTSLWEGYARNEVINFANAQVSKAAFDGLLKFEGVLDDRCGKEWKSKPPNNSNDQIPASYFIKTRCMVDDNILEPNLNTDTTAEFVEARDKGPANPSWRNVLIEKDGANSFLKTLGNYVSQMVAKDAILPIGKRLTPCEAITFIAFGLARPDNQSAEISSGLEDDKKLFLAEQLVIEAAQLGQVTIYGKGKVKGETRLPPDLFRKQVCLSVLSRDLVYLQINDILHQEKWSEISIDGEDFRSWLMPVSIDAMVAKTDGGETIAKIKERNAPALSRAKAAIAAVYPNGIPSTVGQKNRNAAINGWLSKNGHESVAPRTIVSAMQSMHP